MPGAGGKFAESGNREAIHKLQITRMTTCNTTNFELKPGFAVCFPECEFEEISTSGKCRRKGVNLWVGTGAVLAAWRLCDLCCDCCLGGGQQSRGSFVLHRGCLIRKSNGTTPFSLSTHAQSRVKSTLSF